MSWKKTPLRSAALVATTAVSLSTGIPSASSGPPEVSEAEYRPIQSISYEFGSKSTSGYFVQQEGACFVVLMITENSDPEARLPPSPTRVRLVLSPGEIAGIDSEEGRSLNFTCGEAAATLLVTEGSRDWLVDIQRVARVQTAAGPQGNEVLEESP
jgi:hypothetical protein